MSIDFDRILRDHCGPSHGFFSPLRCEQISSGLYDGLWVASTDAGDLTQVQPGEITRSGVQEMAGYGTAFDRQTAICRAVGEAVERYACVMFPGTNDVRTSSWADLAETALHPDHFPKCAAQERAAWTPDVGLRHAGEQTCLEWVRGWSLSQSAPTWVPLDMAYIGRERPITDLIAAPISTGFAAGPDMAFAAQSGLQEVIERDAVALWWWGKRRVPHLDPARHACPTARSFIERARTAGTQTLLLNLTTDIGVPVVGALQLSNTWPYAVFMSACRGTYQSAILRAIEEIGSVRQALDHTSHIADDAALLSGRPHSPVAFALYHAARADHRAFEFCLTPSRDSHPEPVRNLTATVARLKALGHEVLMVDCTKPETRALGFHVVRIIVPGLMGLSFTHAIRFLGEPRFHRLCDIPQGANPMEVCNNDPLPFA